MSSLRYYKWSAQHQSLISVFIYWKKFRRDESGAVSHLSCVKFHSILWRVKQWSTCCYNVICQPDDCLNAWPNSPMLGSAVSIETQNKWLNEVILFVIQENVTPWAHSCLPTGAVLAVLRCRGRDVCLHPRLCWLLLPDRDEQPRSRVPEAPQWNHRWLWWGETADFQVCPLLLQTNILNMQRTVSDVSIFCFSWKADHFTAG